MHCRWNVTRGRITGNDGGRQETDITAPPGSPVLFFKLRYFCLKEEKIMPTTSAFLVRLAGLFTALLLAACQPPTAEPVIPEEVKIDSEDARISYELGFSSAAGMKEQFGDHVEVGAFNKGVEDALSGSEKLFSDSETGAIREAAMRVRNEVVQQRAQQNLAEGQAFLAENGAREGVVTLESGLQYEVLVAGPEDGAKPKASDQVTTHYRGMLLDGTQFDSSYDRNQRATFPLNGVIPGWTEALQLMTTGSKWKLFIPSELAYGTAGRPGIPPNSTLIFEVELFEVGGTGS